MGDKTIEMTLRYSHLSPRRQLDAMKRLDREPTGTKTGTDGTGKMADVEAAVQAIGSRDENWRGRRDSNPRPTGSKSDNDDEDPYV